MGERLGIDCILYIGDTVLTGGPPPAGMGNWSEVTKARDVTTDLEAGEADVTSRGNKGYRKTKPGLKDGSLEFELIWDGEDAPSEAIRAAYFARTPISIAAMDGDIATTGSAGFVANYSITGFRRGEPLEEGVIVTVTAKPADMQQWYKVPA